MARQVGLGQRVLQVRAVRQGPQVPPDQLDRLVHRVHLEQRDLWDRGDQLDLPVPLESLALVVQPVLKEAQVLADRLVLRVERVQVVRLARLARRVPAVFQGRLERLVGRDLVDLLVFPE